MDFQNILGDIHILWETQLFMFQNVCPNRKFSLLRHWTSLYQQTVKFKAKDTASTKGREEEAENAEVLTTKDIIFQHNQNRISKNLFGAGGNNKPPL